MKVTILGNSGPYEAAGSACSGYLFEADEAKILLDCGNGVLSNLQKFCSIEALDAIILSHLHSDHMADMLVLKYAISIKNARRLMNKLIPVYAPQMPEEEYNRLNVKDAFILNPITEKLVLNIKGLKITFREMRHPVKTFAVCIEKDAKRFVYSGDTAWNDNIIDFARGADMLLVDTGLQQQDKTSENVPHLTSLEVGVLGQKAAVKRLMLTHFWPEHDIIVSLNEARQNFEGAELSQLLMTYEI